MRHSIWIVAATVVLGWISSAQAQVAPFVNNSSFFQPEVDIVNSGTLLDVQATVSADRKYVTMTMRPQMSQLISMQTFTFQNGNANGNVQVPVVGGIVGGVNPAPAGAIGAVPFGINAPIRLAPGKGGALLIQRGITPIVRD